MNNFCSSTHSSFLSLPPFLSTSPLNQPPHLNIFFFAHLSLSPSPVLFSLTTHAASLFHTFPPTPSKRSSQQFSPLYLFFTHSLPPSFSQDPHTSISSFPPCVPYTCLYSFSTPLSVFTPSSPLLSPPLSNASSNHPLPLQP